MKRTMRSQKPPSSVSLPNGLYIYLHIHAHIFCCQTDDQSCSHHLSLQTLNDIVEKGFGGPDSYYLRFEMEDDLLYNIKERWNSTGGITILRQLFYHASIEKSKIYADEIQDFLNEELEENFSTICDDNAPREVCSFFMM